MFTDTLPQLSSRPPISFATVLPAFNLDQRNLPLSLPLRISPPPISSAAFEVGYGYPHRHRRSISTQFTHLISIPRRSCRNYWSAQIQRDLHEWHHR